MRSRTSEGKRSDLGLLYYFSGPFSVSVWFCQLFELSLFRFLRLDRANFALTNAKMEIEKEVKKVSSPTPLRALGLDGERPEEVCRTLGRWREKLQYHRHKMLNVIRLSF